MHAGRPALRNSSGSRNHSPSGKPAQPLGHFLLYFFWVFAFFFCSLFVPDAIPSYFFLYFLHFFSSLLVHAPPPPPPLVQWPHVFRQSVSPGPSHCFFFFSFLHCFEESVSSQTSLQSGVPLLSLSVSGVPQPQTPGSPGPFGHGSLQLGVPSPSSSASSGSPPQPHA